MSNTILTIQEIARQALPRLTENLVFPNLVHKDFSEDFHSLGDTIFVRKPTVFTAEDFNAQTGVNYQDFDERGVEVTLDHIATVDACASAIESATSIEDLNRVFVEPAAAALAEKINTDGLALYKDIPYVVGTAGTTPSSLEDLANIRRSLNLRKAPTTDRKAVWDPEADAKFGQIPAVVNAEKSGSVEALREGSIGRVFGIDHYMSQGVANHVTGIISATAVKVNGGVSAGANKLSLDATSLTGKFVPGDLISIGGVCYTVTKESAQAASNAIADIEVYPALPDIADNTDVTLIGSHTANLAFHPMAFAYVTRPLINPDGQGVASYVTSFNGLTLRVTKGYDQKYKRSIYSMDVLYGFKTIYPELAVRCLG
ncbi:MAG: P22 phage major capsid protein family protein [Eubacteriales bacterium]|nr:P22 phage major capsid protein family protein [Eubacteriales bacterium]